MNNERGMALALTLIVMLAIASLTMALLGLAALEPRLTANLSDSAQARFAAEAGIEWATNVIAGTTDWSTLIATATSSGVPLTAGPTSIGNLGSSRGTFTVRVRNDTCAAPACPAPLSSFADTAITGEATTDTAGSATQDRNSVLIVSSTGTQGTAVKNLVAVVKRVPFPNNFFNAALNFPGNESETYFNADNFEINGNGYTMSGSPDAGCAPVYGIGVSSVLPSAHPGANEAVVQNSLSSTQKNNVMGKKQLTSGLSYGDNVIAQDPLLTPTVVKNYIDLAKDNADVVLQSHQPSGLSYSDIGSTCASNYNSSTCWGTATNPKIVWVKGDADPSSAFSALTLSGTSSGYGILIVEDGDFRINGNFNWSGVVIVTGQYVGLGFMGTGTQMIYGAVIVNETAADPGYMEGYVTGNSKIRYSCEAITFASTARRLTHVTNWREAQ